MRANGWEVRQEEQLAGGQWRVVYGELPNAGQLVEEVPTVTATRRPSQRTAPPRVSPAQPDRQKTATGFVILAVLAACAGFFLWGQIGGGGSPTAIPVVNRAPAVQTSTSITYTVTGGNGVTKASLTYENEQGGTEQMEVSTLPWTKSFTVKRGTFVYLSAQNTSRSDDTITCEITANGSSFKRSQSSGIATIATCSGAAP
jgi:hypothetical protein